MTVDALAAAEFDAEVEDVTDLFVDHRFGQAEFRNLRAHHAAGFRVAVEHDDVIAERREIARHGQRGGPGADQRDALAVLRSRRLRQPRGDVVLVVGGDALQAADRDRLVFDAAAPAGRLAGAVAGAAEHARKHVGLPVDHVGVGVTPCRDQADIFGHRRVRRAGPLAVDDFVEVVRVAKYRYSSFIPRNAPRSSVEMRDVRISPRKLRRLLAARDSDLGIVLSRNWEHHRLCAVCCVAQSARTVAFHAFQPDSSMKLYRAVWSRMIEAMSTQRSPYEARDFRHRRHAGGQPASDLRRRASGL